MLDKTKDILYDFKKNKILVLMLLPAVLYFFIFNYIPMVGLVMAFKRFDYSLGIFKSPGVGFENFRFFFESGKAFLVTRNTVLYNIVFMTVNTVLQVSIAIFLSEMKAKYFKKISQTMMLLPYFLSWVVVKAIIYNLFNYEFGSLNTFLKVVEMEPVDFMGNVAVWKYIIVIFCAWNQVGYGSIVYLAAITSIDRTIYESANIDGANIFQQIFNITIPSIRPTIVILLLMGVGGIFRGNFDMFYQIVGNNGLLFNSTDVIDTFVFRSVTSGGGEFGMTTAIGMYQSILCFAILMVTNRIIKKIEPDYALF